MEFVCEIMILCFFFFFSSRRRHTRFDCDWSSDVCSSDLAWEGSRGVVCLEWHFRHSHQRAEAIIFRLRVSQIEIHNRHERPGPDHPAALCRDRKSTRLNSSHSQISYAVFCLKKKKKIKRINDDTTCKA